MVEHVLAKDETGVRFSLPAPSRRFSRSKFLAFFKIYYFISKQNKGFLEKTVDKTVDMCIKDIFTRKSSILIIWL